MSTIALYIRTSPWGDVTPDTMYKKGMGGRESALVNLAQEFGKLGHRVYCFVPMSGTGEQTFDGGGIVTWIDNSNTEVIVPALDIDFFCSWEDVAILHAVRPYVATTALEMQVAHLEESYDLDPVDHVCVLSEWAKDFFLTQHPEANDRMVVLPNGIDWDLVSNPPELQGVPEKTGPEFIYSSSPDRGLHHLLAMWPMILRRFAEERISGEQGPLLHVCYGVEKFVQNSAWSHREDSDRAIQIANSLSQRNILYHGKVSQEVLVALHARSDAMLYPADTMQPTETGCISIIEALGSGSEVITTECDCIPSEFGHLKTVEALPLPLNYEDYVETIVQEMKGSPGKSVRDEAKNFARSRGWDLIAIDWQDRFELTHA